MKRAILGMAFVALLLAPGAAAAPVAGELEQAGLDLRGDGRLRAQDAVLSLRMDPPAGAPQGATLRLAAGAVVVEERWQDYAGASEVLVAVGDGGYRRVELRDAALDLVGVREQAALLSVGGALEAQAEAFGTTPVERVTVELFPSAATAPEAFRARVERSAPQVATTGPRAYRVAGDLTLHLWDIDLRGNETWRSGELREDGVGVAGGVSRVRLQLLTLTARDATLDVSFPGRDVAAWSPTADLAGAGEWRIHAARGSLDAAGRPVDLADETFTLQGTLEAALSGRALVLSGEADIQGAMAPAPVGLGAASRWMWIGGVALVASAAVLLRRLGAASALAKGRYELALLRAQRALRVGWRPARARLVRSVSLLHLGQAREVVRCSAVAAARESPTEAFVVALAYAELGMRAEAQDWFEAACRLEPSLAFEIDHNPRLALLREAPTETMGYA